ncbi:MAG TPA: N-acetyltransferase [Dehalococcoidia bacterium]|nr:N-acetyltransferase [Dehalococcoidia bacterium]
MQIEKARIDDVPAIHRLVNFFADRGEMLHRPLSEVYENLRDFFVIRKDEELVACVALHICWSDLAEIKSLAVREEDQDQGVGKTLAEACIEEARGLGIATLFALTYKPTFFEKLGFKRVDVQELPRKVWGECQRCPKFPNCDETALLLPLKPVRWLKKKEKRVA